ncbi:DUF4230 domain-containing protein [Peptoniphilus equinus]|uniref:DUF4230 domain-containing protein n=1 Tax=Peptoniphilus equinus TaxID=3016343 RepID=A0ABY7QU19_9FIRM|nr:DUF4230 domain-containing protein [Peptoniphilus equinus]WBW49574.1 DUF4230 domain-containing protein [Peptoniphilus equinus]
MKPIKRLCLILIVALLIAFAAFFYGKAQGAAESEPTITATLLKNELLAARELTTTKYHYTNMGSFTNQNTFYGYNVPFTKKQFIVAYEGIIHAGVDLSQATVTTRDGAVEVSLPKAVILSHDIDEASLKIFNEDASVFNPIKIEDYAGFAKDQKSQVEKDAVKKGLLVEANATAEDAVRDILRLIVSEDVVITIK